VIDGNLEPLQPGAVKLLNAIRSQQVTVGNHSGNDAVVTNARDDAIQFGMGQRFAATNRDDGGAELSELVDPLIHQLRGNRLGEVIELITVLAGKIAAPDGNDVGEQRMVNRNQCAHNFSRAPHIADELPDPASKSGTAGCHACELY